jgi:hypothetical protein
LRLPEETRKQFNNLAIDVIKNNAVSSRDTWLSNWCGLQGSFCGSVCMNVAINQWPGFPLESYIVEANNSNCRSNFWCDQEPSLTDGCDCILYYEDSFFSVIQWNSYDPDIAAEIILDYGGNLSAFLQNFNQMRLTIGLAVNNPVEGYSRAALRRNVVIVGQFI